jgi:phospholipid-translocating ATPase
MLKEGTDDLQRRKRDQEINKSVYERIDIKGGKIMDCQASEIQVGDLIKISAGQRVPADCVLLYTTEKSNSVFIKTDQLDGETDWKLRLPLNLTQNGIKDERLRDIVNFESSVLHCENPTIHIYEFAGLF